MATDRKLDEMTLSRRRLLGTAAAAAGGAALAGGSLPGLSGRAVRAQDGAAEFHAAWPYQVPPAGHFNLVQGVTNAILQPPNIYADLVLQPMAMYYWASGEWLPLLATEWGFEGTDLFTVKLRQGAMWSDGNEFTSQDVLTSMWCARIMNVTLWGYLDRVEAPDPYTVNFYMKTPSTVVERYVLRFNNVSHAVYGDWAAQAEDFFGGGGTLDDPEGKQLLDQFTNFRPENVVASGPFMFDVESITNSQFTLNKNDAAWNADQVKFDRIVVYNGETPDITPVVLAKDADYATHGFPVATEQEFIAQGIRVLRPPVYSGPALYMNYNKLGDVFNDKRVRQAIAMATDRTQAGAAALGESGIGLVYMSGMSDNFVPLWMSEEDIASLNKYELDLEAAAALLQEAGWTKDGDQWMTQTGEPASWEFSFPAEFADWSGAAQNFVEQMAAFGITLEPRAVNFQQHPVDVNQGNFELAFRGWGSANNPHPHFSFEQDLFFHNVHAIRDGGQGYGYPLQQETESVGAVDLEQLVIESAQGLDEEAQKANIGTIAKAFNELLPIIPIYERYGNNAALEGVRVKAWPADDDPILQNSPYADGIPTMLMYTGKLEPVE